MAQYKNSEIRTFLATHGKNIAKSPVTINYNDRLGGLTRKRFPEVRIQKYAILRKDVHEITIAAEMRDSTDSLKIGTVVVPTDVYDRKFRNEIRKEDLNTFVYFCN
jgi:hypothetical protein